MKKSLIEVLVAILIISAFSVSCSCKAESKTEKSQKDYSITVLVPDEIILVKDTQRLVFGQTGNDPTSSLANGVAEVGQNYIIKNIVPITEKYDYGSRTASLILLVEPRK